MSVALKAPASAEVVTVARPVARSCTVGLAKSCATFKWTAAHDHAWPEMNHGHVPFGAKVLVQMPRPQVRSEGGIEYSEETRSNIQARQQVGLIRAVGPLAFHKRDTLEPWPEGAWAEPGDFVRIPQFGGDRAFVPVPGANDKALFVLLDDMHISAGIACDPLLIKAYV